MYVEISSEALSLNQLGRLLSKRPPDSKDGTGNAREIKFAAGRTARGFYVAGGGARYAVSVWNSPVQFVELCRRQNIPNYVHVEQSCVCPHNLAGVKAILSSVLKGKVDPEWKHAGEKISLRVDVGPWAEGRREMDSFALQCGFQGDVIPSPLGSTYHRFEAKADCVLTLRRIFLICYVRTMDRTMMRNGREDKSRITEWAKEMKATGLDFGATGWFRRKGRLRLFGLVPPDAGKSVEGQCKGGDESLHTLRHRRILETLEERLVPGAPATIVEIGCASGQLTEKLLERFPRASLICVDVELKKLKRSHFMRKGGGENRVRCLQQNALYPPGPPPEPVDREGCSALVACEVLEHFPNANAARRFVQIAADYWGAELIVATTPNRDYNARFPPGSDLFEGDPPRRPQFRVFRARV